MPSAPRLVGRPSVPRALAMPIWGGFSPAQHEASDPDGPSSPKMPEDSDFASCQTSDCAKFFVWRTVLPSVQSRRPRKGASLSAFSHVVKICDRLSFPRSPCIRQKPFTKRKIMQKRRTYDRTAIGPRPASCARHPLGKRPQSEQGGRRTVAQSGYSGEKRGSNWTNVVAPRSALLPPNRYPRLVCALALQNDPPDFWRRGGQKGRSRAPGQRFARMPP